MHGISEEHPRVLLVEDIPGDARLFREVLGESGYEVDLCWEDSLEAGLDALEDQRPDVIVTDLGLPNTEGSETVERLTEAAPGLPIVVLTGQQTMELALTSLDAGATEYLRKDQLMPGLVARALRTAAERKRIEAKLRRQEAALRRSRERYRSLFRDSSDAILVHDLEGWIKQANPRAESLFGVGAGELRGRAITSLFAVGEEDTAERKLEALREGEPFRAISRYERADSSEFWGELSATASEIDGETVVRTMIRDVTEREEAQKELRRQEAQIRDLANSIPGVLYQFSVRPNGTYGFNYLSGGVEDLLGLSADQEDFFERGVERVPESHRKRLLQSIEEAIQKEKAWEYEGPYEKPSGERIWLQAQSSAPERRGAELVYNGVFLDVTERKQREQELVESEARYRAITQSAGDAIVTIDASSTIQFANPAVEDIFGYDPSELVGEPLTTLMPEDFREEHLAAIDRFLETGERHMNWSAVEFPGLRKDGKEIDLSISFSKHETQGEAHFEGIIRDVTERKEREQELRERERQLEQIRENVTDVIWMSSPRKETMEFISEAYENVWGRSTQELKEQPMSFVDAVHPADRERVRAGLETQKENPEAYEETYRVVQPDGEIRWVRDEAAGVYDEEGQLQRVIGIATDITDRKKQDRRLRAVFNNTYQFTGLMEPDGTLIEANDTALQFGDLTEGDVLGTLVWDTYWFQTGQETKRRLRESVQQAAEGEFVRYEVEVQGAEENRLIDFSLRPIVDEEGEVTLIIPEGRDITEQKEAERALQEERDRFETLFQNLPTPVAHGQPDEEGQHRIQTVNRAFEEAFGMETSVARGKDIDALLAPEGRREEAAEINRRALKEGTLQAEVRRETTGGLRDFQLQVATRKGEEGPPEAYAIYTDITEQKKREQALRDRQEKIEALYGATEHLLVATSAETVGERIHDLLTKTFDFPLVGVSLVEDGIIVPIWIAMEEGYDLPPVQRLEVEGGSLGARAIRLGEVVVEDDLPGLQNEIDYGDLQSAACVPIGERGTLYLGHVETGHFDTFDLHLLDVLATHATVVFDRIEREERLRGRRRKIEALYEATSRLLEARSRRAVSDRIHDVLQEVFEYPLDNTGFLEGELIVPEKTTTDQRLRVPHPTPQPRDGDTVSARALRAGETVVVEEVETLDNDIDYGDLSSAAGVPIGDHGVIVVGQADDRHFDRFNLGLIEVLASYAALVLDRLDREDELLEAKEEAEEASRLKSAMLANMSHEVRTPLTSITGFAEILEEELGGKPAEFAESIYRSGQRLMRTLNSILEVSRLQAGVYGLDRKLVALDEVTRETVEMVSLSAEDKSIALRAEVSGTPVEGHWNEEALNRIVENLVENAIKFTPEDGTVEVRVWEEDGEAILQVEDTGVGISEEALPEIFQAFRQESQGLAREYEGSGLGLSIVKEMTEALGGAVEAESERGEGTCFTVRLPLALQDE